MSGSINFDPGIVLSSYVGDDRAESSEVWIGGLGIVTEGSVVMVGRDKSSKELEFGFGGRHADASLGMDTKSSVGYGGLAKSSQS